MIIRSSYFHVEEELLKALTELTFMHLSKHISVVNQKHSLSLPVKN